jgi:hypothetical protein
MRTITTAVTAAILLAGVTACGSSGAKPVPAVTAVTIATPKADIVAQCTAEVADVITNRPVGWDPETDEDAKPQVCSSLTDSEYLDAYGDGLQQSGKEARDALQEQIDEAASADAGQ